MSLRDLVVLAIVAICILATLKKAWYGVLALAVFSYLNPHAFAWGAVRGLPLYQVLFIVVAIKTVLEQDRQPLPRDPRIFWFIVLWLYFVFTTTQALVPDEAWAKLWFVTKIYLPYIFTLILINTREKLYYLILTIAFSIGVLGAKGGLFALATGFSYRIYGPPATQFAENNAFAIAVLIAIPMLILIYRETRKTWLKRLLLVMIPLCFASAIASWSRGAFLSMGVLALLLLWHSKKKYLILPLLLVGVIGVSQVLPEEWFARMSTIEHYEEDASAMGRIRAWKDGWNYVISHPFTGCGFEGWRLVTVRDWHSSFVEMLSEHGFIAFSIWMYLIISTLVSLTRLPKLTRGIADMKWVANYSYMLRASLIVYMVGTAFLGLSYWDLLYHLIFISILLKKFVYDEMRKKGITVIG